MTIGDRVKFLRKELDLTQAAFAEKIGLKATAIGLYESNDRTVTERSIVTICQTFNVSEEWLRDGIGEMFTEPEYFSLDEYAKNKGLTALELDIIRSYMELDPATRSSLMNLFKTVFKQHVSEETANEFDIDREVESYRRELEVEKDTKTSSALPQSDENVG
ncbi:MAG: helix-turn-helix domain-containing protein [bacterium]